MRSAAGAYFLKSRFPTKPTSFFFPVHRKKFRDAMKKGTKKRRLNKDDEKGPDKKGPENKTSVEETPSFASFGLDSRLLKAISKQFEKPTLVQAAAIPLALNGRDIVARAKTGSGKTLAYVIPIINRILTKMVCRIFVAPANLQNGGEK